MKKPVFSILISALGMLFGLSLLAPQVCQAQYDPMRTPPPTEELDSGVPPDGGYDEDEPMAETPPPEALPEPGAPPPDGTDNSDSSTQTPPDSKLRKNLWGPLGL